MNIYKLYNKDINVISRDPLILAVYNTRHYKNSGKVINIYSSSILLLLIYLNVNIIDFISKLDNE